MDKKQLSETDVITKFILPAIESAGWDKMSQLRQEVKLRDGKVIVRGQLGMRKTVRAADLVLYYKPNLPLAVIEAKANKHEVGKGIQQGLDYARLLGVPFVFASNGDGFIFHHKTNPQALETEITLAGERAIDKLKQTILQLAVMGKLVPQDPNDEPASELLKRIAAEKEQLIKEKKIKRQKALPPIGDDEKPFELPHGWALVRLGDLASLITKGSSPKWQGIEYTDRKRGVLFVTSENVGQFEMQLNHKKYVEIKFNEVEPRSILKKGDFLMNIVGASIGRTAMFDMPDLANINQAVCLIRVPWENLDPNYLLMFFNSETCRSYMFDNQVDNARANLSMGNIARFVIPVPPMNEQKTISALVRKLFDLCDQLKERLKIAQQTQQKFTDAAVSTSLAESSDP